ncbi:MAG: esterase-like activity of phytase family protein [Planctomycetota bacterium]
MGSIIAAGAPLRVESVGLTAIDASGSGTSGELSGIAWLGDSDWITVADGDQTVYPLRVQIDAQTGRVDAAQLNPGTPLDTGSDLEGIAWDPVDDRFIISDEVGPNVRKYEALTGREVGFISIPDVFSRARPNYSLESWSRQLGGRYSWTANEEALEGDGNLSNFEEGTTVRLQRFDETDMPAGQWAYRTERITGDSPFIDEERSGVADLLALPDGRLLVLERELGAAGFLRLPKFRSRLYEVDFGDATDTSEIEFLEGTLWTPVTKTLLWQDSFDFDNFEGIALGPRLDDGAMSVLLISDNGGGPAPSNLFAIRLYGVELALQTSDLIRSEPATFQCSGAWPNETVIFIYSLDGVGDGPSIPALGGLQIDLLSPVTEVGRTSADARGTATLKVTIPTAAPPGPVALQAVARRGAGGADSLKSNVWLSEIR